MNLRKIFCFILIIISINFQSCDYFKSGKSIEIIIEIVSDESADETLIEEEIEIISNRLNLLGIHKFGIKRLSKANQYLIKIRNVSDDDIPRINRMIAGSGRLDFWETYDFKDISEYLIAANDKFTEDYKSIKKKITHDTEINDSMPSLLKLIYEEDSLFNQNVQKGGSLFSYLQPNIIQQEGQYYPGQGPVLGRAEITDTAIINKILKMESIRNMFPKNMKCLWTKMPIKDGDGLLTNFLELVALKMNSNGKAALGTKYITDAKHHSSYNGGNEITITMNAEGSKIWEKITEDNIGKSIAIVLDNHVYSYPTVQGAIPNGRSSITGDFTIDEAKDLANILKAGELKYNINIIEQKIINSS